MTMFPDNNKPRALMNKPRLPYINCCPEESQCCDDATPANDPTPPTNCAWILSMTSNTGQVATVTAPTNSSFALDLNQVAQGTDASITFDVTAVISTVGAITVSSSTATGLDGASTYVGSTPVVPVSNTATVGFFTIDTTLPLGIYATTFTIVTDCATLTVTVTYEMIV